jgi:hypothetical protein
VRREENRTLRHVRVILDDGYFAKHILQWMPSLGYLQDGLINNVGFAESILTHSFAQGHEAGQKRDFLN